ncbi:aminoglycoside phosphotransferase family protein [Wenjunlia tyrosinilytica]|nr:aminoglycoside phosphotransferase family protein [Wenjunlia tyrosinilytica]
MTAPAPLHGGFEKSEMYDVLERACAVAGLDSSESDLLRGHTNAVVRLRRAPVVVKIARKGTPPVKVGHTVAFVRWLMSQGFPTVPLHTGPEQPMVVNGHAVTFWTYLPPTAASITAADLAEPLKALHRLPPAPVPLPRLDNIAAIRTSLAATRTLPDADLAFLARVADQLEHALSGVAFVLPEAVIQGDPQHRNALRDRNRTVLCDWDTIAYGQPEWDLTTVEVHCRRFGYGQPHYASFADTYGFDVTAWSGYPVLRDIRELRMITTNARKAHHAPGTIAEVRRRIAGLRESEGDLAWSIL